MNTHTYEIVDAALRHPNAIVDVWGPGWKGYDISLPVSVNVKRRQQRIHQLEQSKTEHEIARFSQKGGAWFGTRVDSQGEEVGEWVEPEWIVSDEPVGCGPVRYDIVLTISYVAPCPWHHSS
jgi:hypothetical protein